MADPECLNRLLYYVQPNIFGRHIIIVAFNWQAAIAQSASILERDKKVSITKISPEMAADLGLTREELLKKLNGNGPVNEFNWTYVVHASKEP